MDRVEIDPHGLTSSVAQTTAAAAGMALETGQAACRRDTCGRQW
jgi:hypothetical protein